MVIGDLRTHKITGLPPLVMLLATPLHLDQIFPARPGLPCAESFVTLINVQLPDNN